MLLLEVVVHKELHAMTREDILRAATSADGRSTTTERTLTPMSQNAINGFNVHPQGGSSPTMSKLQHMATAQVAPTSSTYEPLSTPLEISVHHSPKPDSRNYSHGFSSSIYPPPRAPPRLPPSAHTMSNLSRKISTEFGPTSNPRSISSNNLRLGLGPSSPQPPSPPPKYFNASMAAEESPYSRSSSRKDSCGKTSPGLGVSSAYNNINLYTAIDDTSTPILEGGNNGTPNQGWSSAIGRANLGKSGRVIERLMGENDMLKRNIQIERLKAEDSRQAVKLAEGKMDTVVGEYEAKLHDAAINNTLLKRRERQLLDLKGQVEAEKEKAARAAEREKGWREEAERVSRECTSKVERAVEREKVMEGRNNVMVEHWADQKREVADAVKSMRGEIETIQQQRREDDTRLNVMEGLCRQQAEQLRKIESEKEEIRRNFEEYKRIEQEALRDIKEGARRRQEVDEERLREATKALAELKWALGVTKNIRVRDAR